MNIIAVIPARYGSTRFAGKPLAMICGKPMIQLVYENAAACGLVDRVVVATDSEAIAGTVRRFGGEVCMTSSAHQTGTDRVAEAVRHCDARIVVNVQGDEPLLPPDAIAAAVKPLVDDASIPMATLKTRLQRAEDAADPNIVKVVSNRDGFALYFSRSPIPYGATAENSSGMFRHVGLYVYTRQFLMAYAALPQTELEKTERLEQLRVLEHGYPIRVVATAYCPVGVDVPEDIPIVERMLGGQTVV